MQDTITLDVQQRDTLGKAVKRIRREGLVPAVVHDHGKQSLHIQADYQQLHKVYLNAGKHHPIELVIDGKKYTALIKHATFNPRYNTISHVVFNSIKANEKVEAEIPVAARFDEGNDSSPAERAGFIVLTQTDAVLVKALPKHLPNELTYDGEKLAVVGDQVTVSDLDVPEGVSIETDGDHVLATVFEPSALAAANDEAGGDAEAAELSSDKTEDTTTETVDAEQPTEK